MPARSRTPAHESRGNNRSVVEYQGIASLEIIGQIADTPMFDRPIGLRPPEHQHPGRIARGRRLRRNQLRGQVVIEFVGPQQR
jgi:hypothetical protein